MIWWLVFTCDLMACDSTSCFCLWFVFAFHLIRFCLWFDDLTVLTCNLMTCFYLWFDGLWFSELFLLVIWFVFACLSIFFVCDLLTCYYLCFGGLFLLVIWLLHFTCDFHDYFCYLLFEYLFLLMIWWLVFTCDLMVCFYLWFICFNTVWTLLLHGLKYQELNEKVSMVNMHESVNVAEISEILKC